MTINEQERVLIFRRIIKESDNKIINSFKDYSDTELLNILNETVLPNSISIDNLKYTLFFNLISNPKKQNLDRVSKALEKIKELYLSMSKLERDVLKFGLFFGYKIFNWKYQMNRYVSNSSSPEKGELEFKKNTSSFFFKKFFPFAFNIINRGEKNERFPKF